MVTWRDAWRWGSSQLRLAGVGAYSREAHSLLELDLDLPSPALMRPGERVEEGVWLSYVQRICRRVRREPLQYIRGEVEFHSLPFHVRRGVLIPRPDTEVLLDEVLRRKRALPPGPILDLGTGTGALAVSMAYEMPDRCIIASDICAGALEVARENARRNGVLDRISLVLGNLFAPLEGRRFAAIVSNPPYVRREDVAELAPEVRDWEPVTALDGGEDGLSHVRAIVAQSADHLVPRGLLALEVGLGQADDVASLCEQYLGHDAEVILDLAGIERVVLCQRGDCQ